VKDGYAKAISLAEEDLRVNARNARTLSLLGLYNAFLGDAAAARSRVQAALVEGGSNPDVLLDVATVYEVIGDLAEAARWAQQALNAGVPWDELSRDSDLQRLVKSGSVRAPN
jgi:tetratricopeptide (TPR) repeat protein